MRQRKRQRERWDRYTQKDFYFIHGFTPQWLQRLKLNRTNAKFKNSIWVCPVDAKTQALEPSPAALGGPVLHRTGMVNVL